MSHSLRDQLLKTGLASESQAKKADQQAKLKTHQQQKKKRKHKKRGTTEPIETDSIAYQAEKARKEEIERAKELNRQRDVQRLEKELRAQVRDLIQRHTVVDLGKEKTTNDPCDDPYADYPIPDDLMW